MIKIAICDDEPYMQEDIAAQLLTYMKEKGKSYQLSCFDNGRELLQCNQSFDLLFLDIQMDGLNGLKTAKLLRRQGFEGFLVFITVLKEKVFDSFEVEAYDYLLKPVESSRFQNTMDRVLKALGKRFPKKIIVQKENAYQVVSLDQISYCEVSGRKVYLHIKNGDIVDFYCKLEELEQCVDSRFFKCHRSYLVNLDYVKGLKEGLVILSDGGQIPVSRLRKQEITQALLCHMKERKC